MSGTFETPSLPAIAWISLLKEDDRNLLSSYGEFVPGHAGTAIIRESEVLNEFFIVISGQLEVRCKQADGTYQTLSQVGPGDTLGEVSMFDPGLTTASVVATTFSQLWKIADSSLNQFIEDNPGAGNILLTSLVKILCKRLRQLDPTGMRLHTTQETAAESDAYSA